MKKALLLIHGYAEDTEETYGRMLTYVSFSSYDIIKHDIVGQKDDELFEYEQAYLDIENRMKELVKNYDEINVIGFSMGGVLASYIASKYTINRLILVAPAFKYLFKSKFSEKFGMLSKKTIESIVDGKSIDKSLDMYIKENTENGFDILEKVRNSGIKELPSVSNFIRLVEKAKREISTIDCQTLIIHGSNDELIPVHASLYILEKITDKDSQLIIAPKMYHRMLDHNHSNRYYKIIEDFITTGEYTWQKEE